MKVDRRMMGGPCENCGMIVAMNKLCDTKTGMSPEMGGSELWTTFPGLNGIVCLPRYDPEKNRICRISLIDSPALFLQWSYGQLVHHYRLLPQSQGRRSHHGRSCPEAPPALECGLPSPGALMALSSYVQRSWWKESRVVGRHRFESSPLLLRSKECLVASCGACAWDASVAGAFDATCWDWTCSIQDPRPLWDCPCR